MCAQHDVRHLPLRRLDELLRRGELSKKEAEELFWRINDRYQNRDVLTDEELAALSGLRDRITDLINPYPVEQLDKRIKEYEEKWPEFEHFYGRAGTMVTWHMRRREVPAGDGADQSGPGGAR